MASVWPCAASAGHAASRLPSALWPETKVTAEASLRWVSGMPADAAQPRAAVTPGTIATGRARCAQRLDLLAAAAEDEGIARLQAHHRLAGAHAADQLGVDLVLRPAGVAFALADRDELGVAARARQHRRRHEVVVQDGVGLAQELRGLERQKIGIAGAGADDMGDAHRRQPAAGVVEFAERGAAGAGIVAGEHQARRRSLDQPTPEGAAAGGIDDQGVDLGAEGRGQPRQVADALGQHRLDAAAQGGRQASARRRRSRSPPRRRRDRRSPAG